MRLRLQGGLVPIDPTPVNPLCGSLPLHETMLGRGFCILPLSTTNWPATFTMGKELDNHLSPRTQSVRKEWFQEETRTVAGSRTFVRVATERNGQLAMHVRGVTLDTLRDHGWVGRVGVAYESFLENEAKASEQMIHLDIPVMHRHEACTAILATTTPFVIDVEVNGLRVEVVVPKGHMILLGSWCRHGGAGVRLSSIVSAHGSRACRAFVLLTFGSCSLKSARDVS